MMNAIDLIRWALQMSDEGVNAMAAGLRDFALTRPTPGAKGGDGNHALWTLGHMAFIEGGVRHIVLGESHPLEHWAPLFATGTQPKDDAGAYPSFDEVLKTLRDLRAKNLKLLDQVGEAGLDRAPKNVPPGFEEPMKTVGRTFLLIALHQMVHYGQLADVRRVVGLKPLH
jgi:hypothetical protein